jgi:hypothetical protein
VLVAQVASVHQLSLVDAEAVHVLSAEHPAVSYWFNGLNTVEIADPVALLTVTEN